AALSIASRFPFDQYNVVMDLGGGIGTLLCAILEQHPHLYGIIYEIESLKTEAEQYIARSGLSARTQVQVGDFIKGIPHGPDLYMIKNSLWNWNDAQCADIMRNVHAAARKNNAKFLIIEYIIDDENAAWTTLYDLQILNMPGGKARTLAEYESLLKLNDFVIV